MNGWIKLHRILLDKPIWQASNCFQRTVLITLLLMANHEEKEWFWKGERFKAKAGQFITSLPSLKKIIGKEATEQKLRTSLEKFKNLDFLTDEATKTGRLITIVNWELYQLKEEKVTDILTDYQRTGNGQVTANKNNKNYKNDKKKYICSKFDLFWEEYPRKIGKQTALKAYQREVTSEVIEEQIMTALSVQKKIWRDKKTDPQYIPHPSTWLNGQRYRDEELCKGSSLGISNDDLEDDDPWST